MSIVYRANGFSANTLSCLRKADQHTFREETADGATGSDHLCATTDRTASRGV